MNKPRISTIIPAFRAARTIGRAVDSVLAQTRPPEEIVVVDDGSPDDLAAALRSYGDRVRLIRKANGGAGSARNFGIARSRGDLIAFLDADDYWEPCKLERQLAILESEPRVGLVSARYFNQEVGRPRTLPLPVDPRLHDQVLTGTGARTFAIAKRIWTSTVVVRRNVLGIHRFDEGLRTAEDVDLWVRLVSAAPVYMFGAPLATAVLEAGSLSRSDIDADCRNMLGVIHRHASLLERRGVRQWETYVYRNWAANYLGTGRPAQALPLALSRLRRQPASPQAWWIVAKAAALAGRLWLTRGLAVERTSAKDTDSRESQEQRVAR
jgi:glycosyltransferase involved in cell wall biosynthesis